MIDKAVIGHLLPVGMASSSSSVVVSESVVDNIQEIKEANETVVESIQEIKEANETVVESIQEVKEANENLDASLETKAQEKIEALRQRGEPVSILVIGPTGSGKSTLINALMGDTVAEAGHGATSVTIEVKKYKGEFKGVKMDIYNTIGFSDSEGKSDGSILKEIAAVTKFDLVLVCMKLEDRINRDIKKVFTELARSLHKEMWKNAIVVATFANLFIKLDSVPETKPGRKQAIKDKISEFQRYVSECLNSHVDENIIRDIPYCVAGKEKKRNLPTTDDWLKDLWSTCIIRCSDEAQPFLTMLAKHRLAVEGGAVSASAGAGILIGVGIGAVAGSIVPGIGTAIGAGVGGAIGGGAGAIAGGVISSGAVVAGRVVENKQKLMKH